MEYPIITRAEGRNTYTEYGREIVADELTTLDYGKDGITRVYGTHPELEPEERDRRRAEMAERFRMAFAARVAN